MLSTTTSSCAADERVFARDQKLGDNPGDATARRERRARDAAHQSVAAAAEDEADVGFGERRDRARRRPRAKRGFAPALEPQ